MAQIEKRTHSSGKTTYRVRIRLQGMPDISGSFPTRTQARDWARTKEADLKTSRYFPRDEGKNRTFAEFVDFYTDKYLPKNPSALLKQKQLMMFWKTELGKYFLVHITPAMIAERRDKLLQEITRRHTQRSPSTVNRYLAALSKAFSTCIKELGWLKENPVLFITRPKENRPRERYLTLDEITRLLDACRYSRSPFIYPIVAFALATGARRGEILNLKWADVNFEQQVAVFRDTKNGESRSVALTSYLVECLTKERPKRVMLSPYIFPSQDGKNPADIESTSVCCFSKEPLHFRILS